MANHGQPSRPFLRGSALLAILLGLLAVCASGIYLYCVKRNANSVVRIAYELSLNGRPPTIQELRQRFGSALRQPDPCAPDGCGYDLFVSNRFLAAIGLIPYTALRSNYWVKNGVVYANRLEFWTVTVRGPMVLSYVVINYCDHCDSFTISPWTDSSSLGTTGSVQIGYAASAENKRKAIALETECLTRLRGCSNIAELVPELWRQTSARSISCRIPNHEGIVEAPHLH
jgi:hypothetical protein